MKFSFSTLGCPDYSFDQIIELVKRVGYTGVEMRIYKNTEDLRTLDEFKTENLVLKRIDICIITQNIR